MRYKTLQAKYLFVAMLSTILAVFGLLAPTAHAFELFPKEVCTPQTQNESPVCKDAADNDSNPIFGPDGILTSAILFLSLIIGVAAIVVIMYAGLKYITSGTNPQEVTKARELILYAIVGLIVASAAQFLVRLVIFRL